jgi:hypothetical protein
LRFPSEASLENVQQQSADVLELIAPLWMFADESVVPCPSVTALKVVEEGQDICPQRKF